MLEELLPAQNKSYELGLKLKLPQHVVEAIHSKDLQPDKYLLKILIKFLHQVEPRPTWRVIVQALRSRVVDLPSLAKAVEAAHFPNPLPLIPTSISANPSNSSLAAIETSIQSSINKVREEIEYLEDQFFQLTFETRAFLSEKEKQDKNFLEIFAEFLLNFPVAKKAIHAKFFLKNEDEILKAENIRKLFAILGRYCNYCNYEIIVHIVKKFGDVKLQTSIKIYCESITKFEISTSVSAYLLAISARPDGEICRGFEQMAVKINKPTSVCTLHEIRQLKETIEEKASVHSYSMYVGAVLESSVVVQFLVHPACIQMVYDAILSPDFTYFYDVTVVEVSDNGNLYIILYSLLSHGLCQRCGVEDNSVFCRIIICPTSHCCDGSRG